MPTLYCPKCGYNLTALTENRCPECGKIFDLKLLESQQRFGVSTRSVVLQLIFVPAGFAVAGPLLLCGLIALDPSGGMMSGFALIAILLGITLAHAYPLARNFVHAKRLRDGEDNVAWIFRNVWPCCILFTFVEALLTAAYFAGGCAVIIMNMDFH